MPIARVIPPPPDPSIPLADPTTGLVSIEWYRWVVSLIAALNEMRSAIP